MENKTVWIVNCEHGVDVFDSEKKARIRYYEVLNYLRTHKPDASNVWSYKEYMSVDEYDTHYAIFDAKNKYGESKTFYISYCEKVVN